MQRVLRPCSLSHTVVSPHAAVSTNAVSAVQFAVQDTLLDLPEDATTHTRQVTPRSNFEKGDAELQT